MVAWGDSVVGAAAFFKSHSTVGILLSMFLYYCYTTNTNVQCALRIPRAKEMKLIGRSREENSGMLRLEIDFGCQPPTALSVVVVVYAESTTYYLPLLWLRSCSIKFGVLQ